MASMHIMSAQQPVGMIHLYLYSILRTLQIKPVLLNPMISQSMTLCRMITDMDIFFLEPVPLCQLKQMMILHLLMM